jgi:hypothetical protein
MSASLIVLIPVVLLGLVMAVCFVGCVLHTHGQGLGLGPYQDTVKVNGNLIACWPLDDLPPSTTAVDIGPNGFSGMYTAVAGGFPPDPVNMSAAAPGTFTLNNQPGIVLNDVQNNILTPCASFNGGFVQVKSEPQFNQPSFTVEAWVKPAWTANDVATAPANRAAVVLADPTSGWALIATSDNFWEATVAVMTSMGPSFFPVKATQPITLDGITTYFLAMTYDGTTLTLYVGIPGSALTATSGTPNDTFQAASTRLVIGTGRPDLTNGLFPFNGLIQDVAYYNTAFDTPTMGTHFALGNPG